MHQARKIEHDIAFSLETTDNLIPEARQANALDHLRRLFELTAAEPTSLSYRDLVELSGTAYAIYNEVHGEPDSWRMHKALHRASLEGRIQNPPPAVLAPNDTATAIELFGTDDLTGAVNAMRVTKPLLPNCRY